MTVSRALNSPERLKPETLARVQLAIEQTSYVPDLSAKKIRGAHASPKTIGVLALDTVTTPFSVDITLSIEETARMHGWNSFVMNMFTDDNPDAIVDLLLAHRPDGIIYTTMGLRQVPLPAKLLTPSPACWPIAKVTVKRSPAIFLMMNRAVYRRAGITRAGVSTTSLPAFTCGTHGHNPTPSGAGTRLP